MLKRTLLNIKNWFKKDEKPVIIKTRDTEKKTIDIPVLDKQTGKVIRYVKKEIK